MKKALALILCTVMVLALIPALVLSESEKIPATSNPEIRALLKPVSYWNLEENRTWNLPDPFLFLDGVTRVATQEDWSKRADEIREMIQYYEYGYKPAAPDSYTAEAGKYTVDVYNRTTQTYNPTEIDAITIHLTVGEKTVDFPVGYKIPDESVIPMPEGGYPAVIYLGSLMGSATNDPVFLESGYAVLCVDISRLYNENTAEGIVKELFDIDWVNDQDAPSALMGWAWGVSRVVDALEDGAVGALKGKINPSMLAVQGMSRNGKGALVAGAFDDRIAVVDPGSSGSGGTAIERFVSTIYAPEYYINTETDKVVLPDQRGKPNIKEWVLGYGSVNAWHEDIHQFLPRYQSLSHAREQNDLWFSSRFQHFKQDETYLIDTVDIWKYYDENSPWDQIELEEGVTGGGPGYGAKGTAFGVMTSLPFDQHFLMSLVAPRGLLVQVGYEDDWNNSESMAFGYYATKGTFEFLQVPENIGIATGDYGHAYGADQARKLVAFANYIMQPQGEIYENKQTFTVYPYPTNDIRRKSDYDKINWTVPGTEAK